MVGIFRNSLLLTHFAHFDWNTCVACCQSAAFTRVMICQLCVRFCATGRGAQWTWTWPSLRADTLCVSVSVYIMYNRMCASCGEHPFNWISDNNDDDARVAIYTVYPRIPIARTFVISSPGVTLIAVRSRAKTLYIIFVAIHATPAHTRSRGHLASRSIQRAFGQRTCI